MTSSLKKMRGSVQLVDFQRCLFTAQELSIPMSRKSSREVRRVDEQGASDYSEILKASIQNTVSDHPEGI